MWIKSIGLISSILLFCISIYLNIKDGYARDEGIYVPQLIGNGLWILLILCICSIIFFLNLDRIKNEKISLILSSTTCTILIVFGITVVCGWLINYNQSKNNNLQNTKTIISKQSDI